MSELGGGNATVLVVDDEECLLNLTRIILVQEGYMVLSAESAEEALQIVESHTGMIDILLTDMRMPNMDGVAFAKEFRNYFPLSKVILMTAYSPADVAHRVSDTTVLTKPFSPELLCEVVRKTLGCFA
ncbi:response regulator [Pontiellaceae bacterium B1224]|nr:response regulator [Pontiellaceae bacterium B1224]